MYSFTGSKILYVRVHKSLFTLLQTLLPTSIHLFTQQATSNIMTLTLKDIQTFKSVIKNSVSLVIHVLYTCSGYHGRMGKL